MTLSNTQREAIITQLKSNFALAASLTKNPDLALFFNNFTDDDFNDIAQLNSADHYSFKILTDAEDEYRTAMWQARLAEYQNKTRYELYEKSVNEQSPLRLIFFETIYIPKTPDEIRLAHNKQLAGQLLNETKELINQLVQSFTVYNITQTLTPMCSAA